MSGGLEVDVRLRVGGLDVEVALEVGSGEVVALLGPNGAGKTTLLRAIAGLQRPQRGRVALAGTVLDEPDRDVHVPAAQRRVGVVFQARLLFPHLSVRDNVAFGPRSTGTSAKVARERADDWLAQVGLADRATDRPDDLSGGQAQRVALARALATDPALLLLDEPLTALDVDARRDLRRLLRDHLAAFDGPAIVVTHDPVEAWTLADRLVVLEDGRVTQAGAPADVTAHPRSRFVAELVGVNLLRGVATGTSVALNGGGELHTADPADGPVAVVVHPRAVAVHRERPAGSPRNVLTGEVADLDVRGDHVRVRVEGPVPLVAEITPAAVAALDLAAGGRVHLAIKATEIVVHADPPAPVREPRAEV